MLWYRLTVSNLAGRRKENAAAPAPWAGVRIPQRRGGGGGAAAAHAAVPLQIPFDEDLADAPVPHAPASQVRNPSTNNPSIEHRKTT